jgi:hypothetical protein
MARRCHRTGACNAAVGSDEVTTSTAVEADRPLRADLDVKTGWVMGGTANIQGREP